MHMILHKFSEVLLLCMTDLCAKIIEVSRMLDFNKLCIEHSVSHTS